jgi:uncharacterized membrane protein (UPF0127 family)
MLHVTDRLSALLGLGMLLLLPPVAQAACPMPLPSLTLSVAGHALSAELAATPEARQCGLSLRDSLPADAGMLFVFPQPVTIAFWMKDTRMPLSIAFLDDQGRILALADMAAGDTRRRHRPATPYRYALETRLGWFASHQVQPGDTVQFELSDAR